MRLALNGGEEFADGFEDVHAELLETVGGAKSQGVYLPSAASDDGLNTVKYWCNLATKRLSVTGATVHAPLVIDTASANALHHINLVANADWIYLGGGKPHVAMQVLRGTKVIEALLSAAARNVLIIGASAGAMMMCSQSVVMTNEAMANFEAQLRKAAPGEKLPGLPPLECLGFIPNSICFPHYNRSYAHRLSDHWMQPAGIRALCIDEQTSLDNLTGQWLVRGRRSITIINEQGQQQTYQAGQTVAL